MEELERRDSFRRGLGATLALLKAPFGSRWLPTLDFESEDRLERGLVIVLPGIEGISPLNHSIVLGLTDACIPYAIRLYSWIASGLKPGLTNLWMKGRARMIAAHLADMVVDYQQQFPGRPIHLVGHSGGAALITHILEELPPGRTLQSCVMIAPALGPRFDLAPALRRIEGKLYNVRSYWDWYFLGVGTTLVGTLDRHHGISAGNIGFRYPKESETERHQLYHERFEQLHYQFRMLADWHWGGHMSSTNRVFVQRRIAPLLRQKTSTPGDSPTVSNSKEETQATSGSGKTQEAKVASAALDRAQFDGMPSIS